MNINFAVKSLHEKGTLAQPPAAKAVAYVFQDDKTRPGSFGRATIRVGLDGQWLGANHGDSYFFFPLEPGEHHLCTDWQSSFKTLSKLGSAVTINAEAGKAYYFRAEILPARESLPLALKLEAVDAAEGLLQISSRILVTSQPKKAAAN
jgi:hypothetical protein